MIALARLAIRIAVLGIAIPLCFCLGCEQEQSENETGGGNGDMDQITVDGDREMGESESDLAYYYDADRQIVLPKNARPEHLFYYVAMSESNEMRVLLSSLQGIVNSVKPEIYLLYAREWLDSESLSPNHSIFSEEAWLYWLDERYNVTHEQVDSANELLDRFANRASGLIVWDPEQPQTLNMATMYAAQLNGLIAAPELLDILADYNLPIIEDLRDRWPDTVSMYRYALDELWPDCSDAVIAFQHAPNATLRDYLISHKIFTFELNLYIHDEFELLEEVLGKTPQNIPILGWPVEELKGTSTFSRFGKFLLASDGCINLSVHSGIEPSVYTQPEQVVFDPENPLPVENVVYAAFMYTDGDAIGYFTGVHKLNWDDEERGSLPLGYEFPSIALDLVPDIAEYYYSTRTENDLMVGPVSGIGYFYPNMYPDLEAHLKLAAPFFRETDLRYLWVLNNDLIFPDDILEKYASALHLGGLFIDYWPSGDRPFHFTTGGTPVFRSQFVYLNSNEQLAPALKTNIAVKNIESPDKPWFVFYGVNAWRLRPSYIVAALEEVEATGMGSVVIGRNTSAENVIMRVVRPDELAVLASSARTRGMLK